MMSPQRQTNASEVFAIVQQISSQVNQDCIQDVVDKVEGIGINDKQLVVNLLGMAFEKSHHLLKNADRVLLLLTKIASPGNILSQNRIINAGRITPDAEQPSDVYRLISEPPTLVKVMKRGKKNVPEAFSERLLTWAHLSHAKILPVYGAFLDGEDGPVSLFSPQMMGENIADHAQPLSSSSRMLLMSDVVGGLCYLHNLNIVHGTLTPESARISESGHAYITDLDAYGADDSLCSIRYSAPEMLKDEESLPTKAADVWSLGCLIYEVLSGKVPFYQLRQERKVSVAIVTGKQPIRPGQEGGDENAIGDAIWRPLSSCWEFRPEDRPSCPQFQRVLSSMVIHDNRPVPQSTIHPKYFEHAKGSPLDLDHARSVLNQIFGSDSAMPPPSQIPEHLQGRLSGLIDNHMKADAVALAATKLSPSDTQTLLDVLDLLWEESPAPFVSSSPIDALLTKIMKSTYIFPHHYKTNGIQYDPFPLAEGDYGMVCKGQDLDVCISIVTNPGNMSDIIGYLALWAHAVHPNILPSYGVFHQETEEISQFFFVTPYMKNGLLLDYARRLSQKDRIPLIFDAVNALVYLQGLNIRHPYVRGDLFLISDEGRALIVNVGTGDMLKFPIETDTSGLYGLRFCAPERATTTDWSFEASAWAFGCLMIEVLSRTLAYHQYVEESEIRSALSRGEPPSRPTAADGDVDEIDDQFWDLIMRCCVPVPAERLTFLEIQKELGDMITQDDRPEVTNLPGAEALSLRSHSNIDWDDVQRLLDQIQIELLRIPLSKLIQNHTKDVSVAAAKLDPDNVQILVDFLDLALKDHITLSDERNRVLALLSRVTTTTDIFPYRYRIDGIKYHASPISEGGFGTVHRGVSDPNICVKVTTKVDSKALMGFIKELVLWAHSSHPNVLPFYGVFVDESKRICLVSPFMSKGNLHDYAPLLAQKKRIPLLHDVIKGLIYLHGLGIVHTDLKGENVLISDEGRGLITDFGASHVITATAKGGVTAASVASTLRFTAPEIVLNRHARPTQECDIWSYGCLFYEVMSRKLPYYEYILETQVLGALSRGQLPKRPTTIDDAGDDWGEFDDYDDQDDDWDEIDDQAWSVIVRCCTLRPEDRPKASQIQELIVDLRVWDDRTAANNAPGTHFLKLRSNPDVDLGRVGDLLNELQVRFLARRTLQYSMADVIGAVSKLNFNEDETFALVEFWDLVLKNHLFTSDENNQALALLSTLLHPILKFPYRYLISSAITYDRASIGGGSFGTVHRAHDLNLCIKVINAMKLGYYMYQRWTKTISPSVYSSHPSILPFYGIFLSTSTAFVVLPFMKNGNIYKHALRLPQSARISLILDIADAMVHLHSLGIVHGNLKGENILITDEGRALVADFAPYHINIAAAEDGPTSPYITSTLRFTAPELVKKSDMLPTTKSDTWSIGCLIYLLLSRKDPFHQYSNDTELRSALSRGELPQRPVVADNLTDMIDDFFWNLITKCCAPEPADRPALLDIRKFLTNLGIQDNRPPPRPCPGAEIMKLRNSHPGVDIEHIGDILARIQSELPSAAQDRETEDETMVTPT